jgi:hypothetical protein
LTWNDSSGHYDVRSPIALRGAALGAPSEIAGTGVSGSASFDVAFGYTGDYTAAAHGLAARVDTVDTVLQDPDQTFDPNDPTGTNAHTFVVGDSTLVRFHLGHPDANVDLDIFLYDSAGNQIANSTNGGTDENIELVLPADDTYTMYVHGWQTAGPSADYTLESWIVPNAAGSLSITSAPTAAVAGTTGTIDIAWAGLAGGTDYLGVVSHDASGVLSLTVVNVDTN